MTSLTDEEADIFIKEKMDVVEEFTSAIYGVKNCTKVNEARYSIFLKKIETKEDNEHFLEKIKSFDSNNIPPCWISLMQKILRTTYVNSMWLNATEPDCVKLQPESYGWFFDEYLKPIGFVGDQTPLRIENIIKMIDDEKENEESSELDDIIMEENLTFDDSEHEEY